MNGKCMNGIHEDMKSKICSLTKLCFFSHLGLVDDVSQDLLLLNKLVLVQHLLLPQVMIVLLLVLLQFIQGALQRPARRAKESVCWFHTCTAFYEHKLKLIESDPFLVINIRTIVSYLLSLKMMAENLDIINAEQWSLCCLFVVTTKILSETKILCQYLYILHI